MKKSNYIRIRLTDTEKENLKALSQYAGVGISQYIRDIIYFESVKNATAISLIEKGVKNGKK